jgi:glucose-6-phosphate isomerase
MEGIELSIFDQKRRIDSDELERFISDNKMHLDTILSGESAYADSLGWMDPDQWAGEEALSGIIAKANEVRESSDVFVLIGVGGSNQAARAAISAFQKSGPEILYAGNNLSPHYMNRLLEHLEGKSVYLNVIAKNFETLEPGICFRILRQYLEKRYGAQAAGRIAVTGTRGSSLNRLADDNGYTFFCFPEDIGGRYSALSDVGLFPMAVAGIDIADMVQGAKAMSEKLHSTPASENMALKYAACRNLLLKKGYCLEMLACFEPRFQFFGKWWTQLFAESEGKDDKGLFPVTVSYSEDLHSIGQYVQLGRKMIFETFLDVIDKDSSLPIQSDDKKDYFDYLNCKDLWDINKAALNATIDAHSEGGIPCLKISVPRLDEFYFGQLIYMFEFACYLSGKILGVNPFDQPGVEDYKINMFKRLGKV